METPVRPVLRQSYPSGATTAWPPFFEAVEPGAMVGEPPRAQRAPSAWRAPEQSLATLFRDVRILTIPEPVRSASEDVTQTSGYTITLSRLGELLNEPETDDYGIARPTSYSYNLTVDLLRDASRLTRLPVARGSVCADSEGRVRVTWRRPERELRLVVASSASDESYVYYEAGDEYGVKPICSARELAMWLDWLAGQS